MGRLALAGRRGLSTSVLTSLVLGTVLVSSGGCDNEDEPADEPAPDAGPSSPDGGAATPDPGDSPTPVDPPPLTDAFFGASPLGQVLIVGPAGEVTGILADDLDTPRGTALAPDGTFFVSVTGGLGGEGGFVLKVEPDGSAEQFVSGISPFDLEIGPNGDLFVSDASQDSILRVPTSGPDEGVVSTFASGFTPSGLGFAPNGDLFAGMQATDPASPGTAGLAQIDPDGTVVQVGILDNPFDVQVDGQGNVFVNNQVPGGEVGSTDGEIALFQGLGAIAAVSPATPIESETFSPTAIRGLAIGPVESDIEDQVFASTADFTIVTFEPFDADTFDPTDEGTLFAGPPTSDVADPFAFDIQLLPGGDFQLLISTDDFEFFGESSLGQVVAVGANGQVSGVLADELDTPRGTALAPDGTFFVSVTGGLGGADGFVLRVDPDGTSEPFVTGISPFDLEIGPNGNLFISDASQDSVLEVPSAGPDAGVVSTFASGFTPSGLGFAPNGDLFAGMQATDPETPGTAGLAQIAPDGTFVQVGILDNPFDVQVDSQGNVFVNNQVPGVEVGSTDGEIAFFPGFGAIGTTPPDEPQPSQTFSPTAIRGLAIGPVGSDIEDQVFASTSAFTIVTFEPFDAESFDPTFEGTVFAGPPISDIADPFAFDIQFLTGGTFQLLISTDELTD